jgi:hypothetical protein
MTDENITAALADITPLQFVELPIGHVGLALDQVEDAGLNIEEVRAWAGRHGGSEVRIDLPDRSLRGGRVAARRTRIGRYFQIPRDQLNIATESASFGNAGR